MSTSPLEYEEDQGVGTLVLSSPPRNELSRELFAALRSFVDQELAGKRLRGLVIGGRGRHFSSGADVPELLAFVSSPDRNTVLAELRDNARAMAQLRGLPFPTIAAISGCCLGVGLELALACDGRISTDSALFALPEAQHGLVPGCGGTHRLVELLGRAKAMEILLRGESFLAPEALEMGLVDALVPRKELFDVARAWVSSHDAPR